MIIEIRVEFFDGTRHLGTYTDQYHRIQRAVGGDRLGDITNGDLLEFVTFRAGGLMILLPQVISGSGGNRDDDQGQLA